MAMKPDNASAPTGGKNFEPYVRVEPPRAGLRKARVSLIVDLGKQNQDPLWEKDGKTVPEGTEGAVEKPRNASKQVAVFVDLVADIRDYGGSIGKQPYRLPLNDEFAGKIKGINFAASPPMDAQGKRLEGKPWGFHPQNKLTKLANACSREDIITEMDLEEFLGLPLMVDVEVKKTENKQGKKDKDGNVIVYTNVKAKSYAKVPEDDDGNPVAIADLNIPAKCIQFDNATKDDVKFLRYSVRQYIKQALNYAGSKMQAAIEAYEAELAEDEGGDDGEEAPAQKAAPAQSKASASAGKAKAAAKAKTPVEDMDDDIPF